MGFFVVALVLTALTTSAFAQGGGNITGTVKDKSGNPIIGAAVTIPNTARGTSTDIDGRYTIKASAKESLNFSYIGYQSQLIQINNRTTIDVVLTEDNTSLEEVVVVGYGVQKKRDIVGAVEQISSKDIADRIGSYQNVSRSLQGAIPGLTVTFSDGKPTRGASFQVRGANSIGAGGSALILVDGVETDITTVNSEDIESISVLKDASSTAVYGSRGTFGVILITTKRPEKGQMKITYNGSYNFYKRTVTPELVDNGYDWTTSYLEAYTNSYATDPTNINNVFRFSRTANWNAATATPPTRSGGSILPTTATSTSATPTGTRYSTRTTPPDTSTTSRLRAERTRRRTTCRAVSSIRTVSTTPATNATTSTTYWPKAPCRRPNGSASRTPPRS